MTVIVGTGGQVGVVGRGEVESWDEEEDREEEGLGLVSEL